MKVPNNIGERETEERPFKTNLAAVSVGPVQPFSPDRGLWVVAHQDRPGREWSTRLNNVWTSCLCAVCLTAMSKKIDHRRTFSLVSITLPLPLFLPLDCSVSLCPALTLSSKVPCSQQRPALFEKSTTIIVHMSMKDGRGQVQLTPFTEQALS